MAKIKVKCPQCEKTIRAPIKMAGRSGKCPGCGHKITIPQMADWNPPSVTAPSAPVGFPPSKPTFRDSTPPSPVVASALTPEHRTESPQAVLAEQVNPKTDSATTEITTRNGTFLSEHWPTICFWLPCALLCLMVMLYGAITVIAYSSGPSNMGAFLAKRMSEGIFLFVSGAAAYGISSVCVARFCKRKNFAAKMMLYVGCLLCMLGAGFALLVFNQAWHTAWLVMLNIDLTWITWLIAWPLVAIAVALIIFHAIKTKSPTKHVSQAKGMQPQVANSLGKYWITAGTAPLALLMAATLLWLVAPPRHKPSPQKRGIDSSVAKNRNSDKGQADSVQPKLLNFEYASGKPNITRFEEVAEILSENYSGNNSARDEMAAREWLNKNELNTQQQASLISLVTPFLSLTEPSQTNRKLLAFYMIERYGGPAQVEVVARTLGSDRQFVESKKVLAFVAKHCEGTKSEVVIDYLMSAFKDRNNMAALDSPSAKNTPREIAEDALVAIGDPVLKRHGATIRSSDDPDFQRLSMRLNKLSSPDLARQCISEIDQGEKRLAVSFATLRSLELAPAHHGEIANAITAKLNSYFQKDRIEDSMDQDAMISLSAILTKWAPPKQSLPIIAKTIKHAKAKNSYGQLDQQFQDIFEFACQSDSTAAADLHVALLNNFPRGLNRAKIHQAIELLGENAKVSLLPLLNSNSTTDREFANKLVGGQGVDQASIIEQAFADLSSKSANRWTVIEKLKTMEIEPSNEALVARQITAHDMMSHLKEVYFRCAGKEELDNLKEMSYSKFHQYRYPAMKRLLEVDLEEGASRLKEIFREDKNGLPYSDIKKFADSSFEPGLLRIVEDASLKPNRYLLETIETIGTPKSLTTLKSFIERIESENPEDKRERVGNGYLVKAAQAAIEKIKSNE